ncbi:MAG: oligosaccharide flippase family protein [Campylobacterota bacterium]|nr:oligosaccharide flippase family protein [Campylobacterota bacterium]
MLNKLKPRSEFSRNVLTLMTGTTIAQAIPIAISPILTRIYTPEDFGVFALFVAIAAVFSTVVCGRYENAIMLPDNDEDAINIFALGFLIVCSISIFLLFIILCFDSLILSVLNNSQIGIWLYFIPLVVFFIGIFNLLSFFNNRRKNYKDISNATIIKSIVTAIVQLSIGFLKQGATGLITGQIVSHFFANLKLAKNITKEKKLLNSVSAQRIKYLAKKYIDFPKYQAPHAFTNSFSSNIPIYLFSTFFNSTVVGFYSLSTRIVFSPLMIIASSSAKVYNQKVSELYNQNADSYGFTIRFLKSLSKKIIVPFILIIIFAPDIFAFVFGEIWREAGIYTQILAPWLFLNVLLSTISYISSIIGKQKKAFLISVLLSFFTIISIIIGIIFNDIYIALFYFSFINSIFLIYNAIWMLKYIKEQ